MVDLTTKHRNNINNKTSTEMATLASNKEVIPTEFLAITVGISSMLGIMFEYPTKSLNTAFIPNDTINLIFGIPLLLHASNKPLLLPGALMYHIYSSLTYVLALMITSKPNHIFLLQLGALYISCGSLWCAFNEASNKKSQSLLHIVDSGSKQYLQTYSGVILILWGSLFILRAGGGLFLSTIGIRDDREAAIHVADMLIGPSWIWCGGKLLALKSHNHSSVLAGISILFQASTLFLALVLLLLIRPYLLVTDTVHDFGDIVVVAAMGLTVIIPFLWMYSRAMAFEKKNSSNKSPQQQEQQSANQTST